ncbi:hypothetical protein M1D49_14315 [Bacillus sp. PK3-056]|jgi:uncharacterized integral membrane protein|uniref:Uncharacterized protein n=1 Tax=Niallia circulans TaxID=1397 RepID=A0AA91TWL9_NIACI|nr:hypothetical protein [Niallia circulans]AYV70889.1 hypothetical protein C2H98_04495 [Niallia circulans]PAD85241.1 hypothetical protein CHH57_00790 [Niallia circulans]
MRKFFSILSVISTLLGLLLFISLLQNDEKLLTALSFGTKGYPFIILLNLYNIIGFLFAIFAERNKYRILLFLFSISMILTSLFVTFVALYGFREP